MIISDESAQLALKICPRMLELMDGRAWTKENMHECAETALREIGESFSRVFIVELREADGSRRMVVSVVNDE